MLCDDLEGWSGRRGSEGGDICIHTDDSLCCIAETNTTLQSSYTPIKNNEKKNSFYKSLHHMTPE